MKDDQNILTASDADGALGRARAVWSKRRPESGDTLIEILIAILILGISSVALLVAFGTSISGSGEHRNLATFDTVLRSAAEEVTAQLQTQSSGAWATCSGAGPGVAPSPGAPIFTGLPTGYSAQVTSVQFWNGSAFSAPATWNSTTSSYNSCVANAPMLIQVTITSATNSSQVIDFVVGNPLITPNSCKTPSQLVFLVPPSPIVVAGTFLNPNGQSGLAVAIEDSSGNICNQDIAHISLSVTGSPSTLCPSTTYDGVATVSGCLLYATGNYTLTVSDSVDNLTGTSKAFTVVPAAASKLLYTQQPTSSTGGVAFPTQPQLAVEDQFNNVVTSDASAVSLAIAPLTPTSGGPGTVSGCTQTEAAGIVSFANCSINTAGTGYQLQASDGTLAVANSNPFNITVGPATQLDFTQQPSDSTGGVPFSTQPKVTVEDAGGNRVTTDSSTLIMTVTPGTPTSGGPGSLTGCSQSEASGVFTISGCAINAAGAGYTLTVVDGSLASDTSSPFTISVGPANKLAFTTQPGGGANGATWLTQPVVTVEDAGGNAIGSSSASVTIGIASQPGSGASLTCSANSVTASGGIASFAGCQIVGKAGTYTLNATASGLSTATSSPMTISVGAAFMDVFTTQPGGGPNGAVWATQPVVTIEDSGGNTVTSSSSSVTLAIASQPGSGATLSCTANPVSMVGDGMANFAGCQIVGKVGSYTLSATASGLGTATSNGFSITFGAASQLSFSTQPSGGANGVALGTQPAVTVLDASGNTVTSSSASVTLAIASQPGSGATLSCTTNPKAATSGVDTFAGCKVVGQAGTYTLSATASGLTAATSNPLTITVGAASQLAFTTQPGGGANGSIWGTQPVVSVEDSGGNPVTSSASVTLAIASQPGSGATLACTTNPVTASGGVATFAGCKITGTAGTYTLSATASSLTSATSSGFSLTFGTATQLVFTTQPGGGANGVAWATQPTVSVEDVSGNTVTSSNASVTLAISAQPGSGATLTCTANPASATGDGVANFAGCQIVGKAGTYTLSAATSGFTTIISNNLTISVGAAFMDVFTTQPGGGADNVAWGTQPVVTIEDSGGNTVTTSTDPVTLAINTQPGSGATLTCTTNPKNATAGVDTFAGCKIVGKVGTYTLSASTTGYVTGTSGNLTITLGAANLLAFTTQPGGGANASAWGIQPVVTVEDVGGNPVASSASVTLAIATQPGSGATLACTTNPVTASGGVATFAGCKITGTAGTYTLSASASGLTSATSSGFVVTVGAATQLVFTSQPGGGANGTVWSTQPTVTVEDVSGNTVTSSAASVTLAIATQPGSGASLTCTANPVTASGGVASFAGCQILGKAGTYTLSAAATGFTTITSSGFSVTFGAASQLAFTTQPVGGANGAALGTQPVVTVQDVSGNTVTSSNASVTLAIATQPGSGATLSCTTDPVTASGGVATFAGCKVVGQAGTYTLSAAASGFTTITSNSLTITVGAASQLAFTTQPSGGTNGVALGTQPVITVQDSGGNTVTGSSASVTLGIATQPGSGATVTCTTNPLTATSGVATFAGCKVTGTAGTYTLSAAASGLTTATSNSLTITVGTASQLAFTTQPGGGTNDSVWGTQPVVTVEDSGGNPVSSSVSVTLAINTQPGSGAVLACTTNPVTASGGVATFAGCKITGKAGTYTLSATASGLTTAISSGFSVTFGTATQLVFTTQPGGGANGAAWATQPAVTAEDVSGNAVTSVNDSITLAINTQPGSGASLTCTANPLSDSGDGIANFAGCQIVGKAGTYTLSAAASGYTTIISSNLTISVGAAFMDVFTTQPGGGANNVAWGTQPVVTIEDSGGNTVTTSVASVTLAIASQPGSGATLSCTANPKAAVSGVDTFAGCKIVGKAGSYTLSATATGLGTATSNSFNITFGAATKLVFTTEPSATGTRGTAWGTQPVVTVEDSGGNTVTSSSASVSLAINAHPFTAGTLACTANPVSASSGVATFGGCKITGGSTGGYTINATSSGLTTATSTTITLS